MVVKTVAQLIADDATALVRDLDTLAGLSEIQVRNQSDESIVFISPYGHNTWKELGLEGRQLRGKINKEYLKFNELALVLLEGQVPEVLKEFKQCAATVTSFIHQDGHTWVTSAQEALADAEKAVLRQAELVAEIYSETEKPIFIPDTNAILHNLHIEEWGELSPSGFTICLVPTVIAELDEQKVNHKNENVREKAEVFIRKLSDYRKRPGGILQGVRLAGNISVKAVAAEPRSGGLDWINLTNADDRLIASTLEVMRANVHAPVVIVTRDGNLHNKCAFARIPSVIPPEPLAQTKSKELLADAMKKQPVDAKRNLLAQLEEAVTQLLEDFAVCSQPGHSSTHHIRAAANARLASWIPKMMIRKNEVDALFGKEHATRFGRHLNRIQPYIAGADRGRIQEVQRLAMDLPLLVSAWANGKKIDDTIEGLSLL